MIFILYTENNIYCSRLIIKNYNNCFKKIIYLKKSRKSGFISCKDSVFEFYNKYAIDVDLDSKKIKEYENKYIQQDFLDANYTDILPVSNFKYSNNISRARTKIFELAVCNPFSYFVTLTINPNKFNRYNLQGFYKKFSMFLRNLNRNRLDKDKIKYIIIPEQHKDGAWHFHGLFLGLNSTDFFVKKIYNRKKRKMVTIYCWDKYFYNFGINSFEKIKNKEATCKYITKYITKDLANYNKGQRLYYCSLNLNRAEKIFDSVIGENTDFKIFDFKGEKYLYNNLCNKIVKFDYSNDYCSILTI